MLFSASCILLTGASSIQPCPPVRRTTYQRFQHKQTERDNSDEGFAGLLCATVQFYSELHVECDSITEYADMSAGGECLGLITVCFSLNRRQLCRRPREHGASVQFSGDLLSYLCSHFVLNK